MVGVFVSREQCCLLKRSERNDCSAPACGGICRSVRLWGLRGVQALVIAKFMSDSAWYFMLFWLPKYLYDARGFDIKHVSYFAWIPYAASGIGSFLGGWCSSRLLRSGRSLNMSRKLVLGINAAMMPAVMLVPVVPVSYALTLFSVAFFAQQSWSGLIMTIPADVFPLSAVGTVSGLVGFGGAIGGAIFGLIAGALLGHGFTYGSLFAAIGTFHLIGFLVLVYRGGKIRKHFAPKTSRRLRATHEDHRSAHTGCSMGRPDSTPAPALLHQSHGSGGVSRSLHGELCIPRLSNT